MTSTASGYEMRAQRQIRNASCGPALAARRVLFLANSAEIGGGNRSLLTLCKRLQQCGIQVKIVSPVMGPLSDACDHVGISCHEMRYFQPAIRRPVLTVAAYRQWRTLFREYEPSIVHANDIMTARAVASACWRSGTPLVCHVRFPFGEELGRWALRGIPKPGAFIFNSHALQREVGPILEEAAPRSRQFVVHNAVDLTRFRSVDRKENQRPGIGIVANLVPVKGHRDFLSMAKLLTQRGVDAEYWIIGEDIHKTGERQALEQLARNLAIAHSVKFLGHRSDVPEILNQLDVLVCASHVEPFGRCLIEAMACERPVVATRVGGIPEVVDDGVTGILVPAHTPEQLANAVGRLLADPELRRRMGRAGRLRAKQQFGDDAHVDRILAVYQEVLGSK